MRRRILAMLVLVLLPLSLAAQVDEAMEQWAAEQESDVQAGAYADELSELAERRININDTAALGQLSLLSPFQRRALGNYIMLYGQLLSHKELHMVPGFDSATVALLEALTVVQPYEGAARWRPADGHHSLTAGVGRQLEQAAGYRDSTYEGDAFQSRLVYTYNLYNRLSLRLAYDKDPTEHWGRGNFYGYHLMLSNVGAIEKLIVGRYNLQFGQGLTLWTGYAPFSLLGNTPLRFGAGVRPASAFYEEGYQEGVAATLRLLRSWHLSAFASKAQGTRLLGGHAEWRRGNLVAGLTLIHTALDDSVAPAVRVYNADYFRGRSLFNGGVDAVWQWHRLMLYGEVAVSGEGSAAAIGGMRLVADSRNSFGISYRHYDAAYHNLMAQPYCISEGRNEQGWTLDARVRLPLQVDALISADLHSFPSLRYGIYRPSSGTWLRAQLGRRLWRHGKASLRYAWRGKERNVPYSDSTVYVAEQTLRQQLQGEIKWELGKWLLTTRMARSLFESENGEPQKGWVASQQVRYRRGPLSATVAATLFDVDGYYARIYFSESCLQYNFTMPAYYGQGLRLYAVARFEKGVWTVAAKYAVTHYFDRDTVGSGAAATDGPNRQTLYLQLGLRF